MFLWCIICCRINYAVSGEDGWSYHAVNVLLHVVATLLFTFVCETHVFHTQNLATAAGLMFAVHPVHTEAVSNHCIFDEIQRFIEED